MLEVFLYITGLVYLLIASWTDLRTREVPDWITYSLVPVVLAARAIFALWSSDYWIFVSGLLGFGVFFLLGLFLFYTGQWGGADSKLLMGVGALFGLEFMFDSLAVAFVVNLVIVGSLLGLGYSVWKACSMWNKFKPYFMKYVKKHRILALFAVLFFVIGIGLLFTNTIMGVLISALCFTIFFAVYLLLFVQSVETVCMITKVSPHELTEGEWIQKDVYVDKKYVCGPKDLGVSVKQISLLKRYYKQGKIKKIAIKVGIPFVPSFLLSFIITIGIGNLLGYFT